jgi:hypothetical protein
MKKLSFFFVLILCLLVVSCSNQGGMSAKAKKNLETNQAVMKMFESGDFSKIGDYIAADAVDHSGPQGDVKGLGNLKSMFEYYASTMSDTKVEMMKELADDNYVMAWMKQSWTAKADDPMMGMKAGDRTSMDGVEVTKYNSDGKVIEHWGFLGMGDVMKMMTNSAMPPAGADSTNAK